MLHPGRRARLPELPGIGVHDLLDEVLLEDGLDHRPRHRGVTMVVMSLPILFHVIDMVVRLMG